MSTTDLQPAGSAGSALSAVAAAPMSKSLQRQARQALDRVAVNTAVAVATERSRAVLTEEALHNIGALSALEAHLITIAPLGEARYRAIVDACALGSAEAVSRWGR